MRRSLSSLIIVTLSFSIGGCAPTSGDRKAFRTMMDNSVGEKDVTYSAPESVSESKGIIRKVIHNRESNCSFYVEIDKASGKTLGWGFLSDPNNCYLETNFSGPW